MGWFRTKKISRTILFLLFLSLAIRLLVFLYAHGLDADSNALIAGDIDSEQYDRLARNMWQHGVFSQSDAAPWFPEIRRTPGYPFFLAGVYAIAGPVTELAVAVQILVVSWNAPLTYLVARELRLSHAAAMIAGILTATDLVSVLNSNLLLTDSFFTVVLLTSIWALTRYWQSNRWLWLVAGAVFLTFATLIRPVGQYLPFALVIVGVLTALGLRKAKLSRVAPAALAFLLIIMMVLGAWSYRNYQQSGVYTLSTIGNYNLLYWRAGKVVSASEGIAFADARAQLWREVSREVQEQGLSLAQRSELERERAIEIFQAHPELIIKQTLEGTVRLLFAPGPGLACNLLDRSTTPEECGQGSFRQQLQAMSMAPLVATLWSLAHLAAVYIGAAIGIVRLWTKQLWTPLALLLTIVAYFIAVSSGGDTISRMRLPFLPYLSILSGVGVWATWTFFMQRGTQGRTLPGKKA